jgi:hypothetical protein
MKYQMLIVVLLGLSLGTAGAWASDANISGTWACTIEVTGPPGNVTFVFKQEGEKLSGTYSGSLGELPVTGMVKGDKVAFGHKATTDKGHTITVLYTGAIESPAKMTGAVEYSGGARGKWTATKKK